MILRKSTDVAAPHRPMPLPMGNNTNILLIAGSVERALVVQGELQHMGYRVYLSTDGLLGWRRAYSHTPQLILLDRELPTISGPEVLARLKSERATAHIPVVMLGAKDRNDHAQRSSDPRADAYLAGDHTFEQLCAVVRQVLSAEQMKAA